MEGSSELRPKKVLGDKHTFRSNEIEGDVEKLIELTKELPVESVPVRGLLFELEDPCWTDANGHKITPAEVVDTIRGAGSTEEAVKMRPEFADHIRRIVGADYSHPVLIYEAKLIDGSHRLALAALEDAETIPAKTIAEIPAGAIIRIRE